MIELHPGEALLYALILICLGMLIAERWQRWDDWHNPDKQETDQHRCCDSTCTEAHP